MRKRQTAATRAAKAASTPAERWDQVTGSISEAADFLGEVADAATSEIFPSIAGAAASAAATLTYQGTTGDFTSANEIIFLQGKFFPVCGTDPEDYGSPLMKRVRLDTLSGFVLCEHPHIEAAPGATITEIEAIESYLVGGFFFE